MSKEVDAVTRLYDFDLLLCKIEFTIYNILCKYYFTIKGKECNGKLFPGAAAAA